MAQFAVVVVTDDAFLFVAEAVVRDVRRWVAGNPDIWCFHRGLDAIQLDRLAAVPGLTLVPVPQRHNPGPTMPWIDAGKSDLYYARLECWSERFDAYDSVVYVDADTIVLGDLTPLADTDFHATVAGTGLVLTNADAALDELLREDRLPLKPDATANGGVFAVGRRHRGADQLAELERLTDRYGPYLRFADQSVINLWMASHDLVPTTDTRFNWEVRMHVAEPGAMRAIGDAQVLHFNGFHSTARRVAIMNARFWLGVPIVGRYLFVLSHRALFDHYDMRPFVAWSVFAALRLRKRLR